MTDDEALALGREHWPAMAQQEDEAADRLRAVLASGDGDRVSEGSKALADWVDARAGLICYGFGVQGGWAEARK